MASQLSDVLQTYREGHCPVCIQYVSSTEHTRLALGGSWNVQPSDELINRLRHMFNDDHINIIY